MREPFFHCGKKVSDIQGIFSEIEDVLPWVQSINFNEGFFFLLKLIKMVFLTGIEVLCYQNFIWGREWFPSEI